MYPHSSGSPLPSACIGWGGSGCDTCLVSFRIAGCVSVVIIEVLTHGPRGISSAPSTIISAGVGDAISVFVELVAVYWFGMGLGISLAHQAIQ